jgi:hypothetical protein
MWILRTFYWGKPESIEEYQSKDEALARFNQLVCAFKFGVVGFSVSYPEKKEN